MSRNINYARVVSDCQRQLLGGDPRTLQCGLRASRVFRRENKQHRLSGVSQWRVLRLSPAFERCDVRKAWSFYLILNLNFDAFRRLPFLINRIYFWYSLIFLIARTSAMFLLASSINDESKKPLKVLRSIPNRGWFPETERFSQQIQKDCIALTGKKFFYITRGIIISIVGTIVSHCF